jgi:hypothetical protein
MRKCTNIFTIHVFEEVVRHIYDFAPDPSEFAYMRKILFNFLSVK